MEPRWDDSLHPLRKIALGFFGFLLGACSLLAEPDLTPDFRPPSKVPVVATSSPTAFQPLPITPTPDRWRIWISPALPEALFQLLGEVNEVAGVGLDLVEEPGLAHIRIEPGADLPLATWVYALVAPFPTVEDGMSLDELRQVWIGGKDPSIVFHASTTTLAALEEVLDHQPVGRVASVPEEDLLEVTWAARPSLAVVPFEALEPRWKVLELGGVSPIRHDFDLQGYPLVVQFGLSGDPEAVRAMREAINWPTTNRHPNRMTTLVMTGTTALTRSTAWRMVQNGVTYPGERIGQWLREADLAHVSNEIPFTSSCPPPDPFQVDLLFCSSPDYLELFEEIGVDLIELTGNHVNDWGVEAFYESLELLHQGGWVTFGGGEDLDASLTPALVEHNGNRLAFYGCNAVGPSGAWATQFSPGAAPCDMERIHPEVERLRTEGFLPIFTFQWAEGAVVMPAQYVAFQGMIDVGAVIVSGSQAHRPLGMEFREAGFIHYGLGNLFFDQMQALELRQEMIDRHVFYDGRYISTELLTAILEDYAQPRPMTPEERATFLRTIFSASGW